MQPRSEIILLLPPDDAGVMEGFERRFDLAKALVSPRELENPIHKAGLITVAWRANSTGREVSRQEGDERTARTSSVEADRGLAPV
jgi:hypothetical protein